MTDRGSIDMGFLDGIGRGIQYLRDSEQTYLPSQMEAAIRGGKPTGTINIAQNGTVDVTQYAAAAVNVQPNLQSKTATQNGTVTPDSGYDGLSSVLVDVSSADDISKFFISSSVGDSMTGWYQSRTITRTLESGPKLVYGIWRYNNGYSAGCFYTLHDYGEVNNVCDGEYKVKFTLTPMSFEGYGDLPIYAYGGMNGAGMDGNAICTFLDIEIANMNRMTKMYSLPVTSDCIHFPTIEANYGEPYNSMSSELKAFVKRLLLLTL